MLNISMKSMLEAGVHFGHQTYRWNPKMARYIFGERNGIHILDLQKTVKEIKKAYTFVKDSAKAGKTFLFVGTKKQAKEIIREEAIRADVSCVHEKWLGGTLTNFETLRKSLKRLEELEKFEADGLFKVMSKKEVSRLSKEKARLVKLLSGIRNMRNLPDIMFIVDPVNEANALKEAHKLRIPIVGVSDTNCDPDQLDWPIPGNDDAARSIRLFCATIADAVIDGRAEAEAEKAAAHQVSQDAAAVEAGEVEAYAQQQAVEEAPVAEEPVRTEE
ncbi:MAG TPA: 30S ribosomal protein S2 [Elusimicrobia bacterium]|jgi:small subunit ribosomal protein S2|nr:30S ribosomal protein S2 [Elusimicrobiota bacterium]